MTRHTNRESTSTDHIQQESRGTDTPPTSGIMNVVAGYSQEERPLAAYAVLVGIFNAAFAAFLLVTKRSQREIPERIAPGDLVLLGLVTHKLSRIIALDWVMSPVRAPFTRYEQSIGAGEVSEKPRGHGMRRALGELLTCPWCIGPWVASALAYGLVLAPRATRLLGGIFTLVTISDFLHHLYGATKKLST
jgi:hypothetical protein